MITTENKNIDKTIWKKTKVESLAKNVYAIFLQYKI